MPSLHKRRAKYVVPPRVCSPVTLPHSYYNFSIQGLTLSDTGFTACSISSMKIQLIKYAGESCSCHQCKYTATCFNTPRSKFITIISQLL